MSEQLYNITLTGVSEFADKAKAIEAFAGLFKLDVAKAEVAINKAPYVVKKDVNEATVKKFAAAFKKIGVEYSADLVGGAESKKEVELVSETPAATVDNTSSSEGVALAQNIAESEAVTQPVEAHQDVSDTYEPESFDGLEFKIQGRPDYSFLTVQIPADETIKVEASAMATMDTNIRMKTKLKGGFGRFLTGESLFINDFTAESVPGEIGIAPGTPGDLTHQYLDGDTIFLQNSAYVASSMGVEVESKWQGMVKGFFSGESLFLIRCSGKGDLWFNTYGAIIEIDVNEDYVVDTGNIVAFTEGLEYNITKVGGYKSLFFSGEGFVCRFSGKGKVWIQTRSAAAFTSWAHFFRPVQSKSN